MSEFSMNVRIYTTTIIPVPRTDCDAICLMIQIVIHVSGPSWKPRLRCEGWIIQILVFTRQLWHWNWIWKKSTCRKGLNTTQSCFLLMAVHIFRLTSHPFLQQQNNPTFHLVEGSPSSPTFLRKDDGASTVAFLEAAIPTERSHVQLEVDDEPTVPEEPTASMPFVPRWRSKLFVFRFFV